MQQQSKKQEEMPFASNAPLLCKYIVRYPTSASSTLEAIIAHVILSMWI